MNNACQQHIFPPPQYLGAKHIHREWIASFLPPDAHVVLDAFAGSQSIAYHLKTLGKKVIANDFLKFDSLIGTALVENKSSVLTEEDIETLCQPNSEPETYDLMEKLYAGLFFSLEDAQWLDTLRSHVDELGDRYKRALALTVACRAMTRKVTMGHFAHASAMRYANDPKRVKRNPSIGRRIEGLFMDLLPSYNAAVFDNGETNMSYNEDILELLPKLEGVDAVYFDPPYVGSHADYQSFYHVCETFVEYWREGKSFVNETRRYEPRRRSGFDTKKEALRSFEALFERSAHIPYWLLSYNDRSYPDVDTLKRMIERHRKVEARFKTYENGRGGRGSVKGSREALLVCAP